jgi:hypothetical protein
MNQYTKAQQVNQTPSSLIKWMNLNSKVHWQVILTQFGGFGTINKVTINKTFPSEATGLIFDSGSSLSYIPSKDYSTLYQTLITDQGKSCSKSSSGLTYCTCSSINDTSFLNISLSLGERYVFFWNSSFYLAYNAA